jgi:pimeloyl-ACP methyl ester carboxylesterase
VLATVAAHAAQDDAREDRWAAEVEPQVVVGDVEWLATPQRARVLAIYTAAPGIAKGGAVIVHGAGVHPDFGMIGALRTALPEQGIATLAVQMPVLAADAPRERYVELMPAAGERIAVAIAALRAKGLTRIVIVAHSMGAAMADAYLARADAAPIDAWVVVGMLADFKAAPRVPVLDVVAEKDFAEVLVATKLRAVRLPKDGCSAAVVVKGVDHYFGEAGPQAELGRGGGVSWGRRLAVGVGIRKSSRDS